jgi:hypothetical protein
MKREKHRAPAHPQSFEPGVELFPSVVSNDSTHSTNGAKNMSKKFDFNSLVAAEKQQSLDDLAEYQVVLREIARNECDRPQSEILRLLERCERDTSDLQADVEWRVERDEKIAEIKRAEEYRTKNAELLAKLKSMREAFEKAEAEYDATRYPIIYESDALEDKLRKIDYYRDDLYGSCRDANLKLELKVHESSFDGQRQIISDLYARQREINSSIADWEYKREHLPITIDRDEQKKEIKKKIKRLQDEWQQLEEKKIEFEQKQAEHQRAVDAVREKMIYS